MLARRIEQGRQKGSSRSHLPIDLKPLQAEHDRCAMLAHALRQPGKLGQAIFGGIDRDMAEGIGQRHEIALGIDHDLLNMARAPFEQPAQEMRFTRARISLHKQARSQQFLKIDRDDAAVASEPHIDLGGHAEAMKQAC